MRLWKFALSAVLLTSASDAAVVTLGTSNQPFVLTGTGINASGSGTARMTLGSCTYDGTNTTCVLSGPYTGLGNGGVYKFTAVYPGNGPSPLSAITTPPSSDSFTLSVTAGSFAFTLTPTDGKETQFYDLSGFIRYGASATCSGVSTCGVGAVSQSQGGVITGVVTGQWDTTPVVNAVISASAFGSFSAISPATWIEIYGTNLATVFSQTWAGGDFNGNNAPSAIGGTTVTVAGKPGFIDYVSPHQVNVQVPSGIPTGKQTLVVTTLGGPSIGTSLTVNIAEPGLLAPAAFNFGKGQYVVALFSNLVTYALPPGVTNAVPTARAKPGDTIVLYGVGFGTVTPNIDAGIIVTQSNALNGIQFTIGGVPATVQFAGLAGGYLGLYQFNVVVPANLPANDATPITFTLNGAPALQTLVLPIGN
ncbi:MAG TPA: hypothetical protein VG456_18815 [Candidatus Sulfopaludibacter sp.]|jgi:uncharacterized protein (TIGR03437 family)|nr:hypothetical protein [Candidatus Sulfopaludibacter sp.]